MSKRKTVRIDKKQLFNSIIESQEKGELTPEAFLLIEQFINPLILFFIANSLAKSNDRNIYCELSSILTLNGFLNFKGISNILKLFEL